MFTLVLFYGGTAEAVSIASVYSSSTGCGGSWTPWVDAAGRVHQLNWDAGPKQLKLAGRRRHFFDLSSARRARPSVNRCRLIMFARPAFSNRQYWHWMICVEAMSGSVLTLPLWSATSGTSTSSGCDDDVSTSCCNHTHTHTHTHTRVRIL